MKQLLQECLGNVNYTRQPSVIFSDCEEEYFWLKFEIMWISFLCVTVQPEDLKTKLQNMFVCHCHPSLQANATISDLSAGKSCISTFQIKDWCWVAVLACQSHVGCWPVLWWGLWHKTTSYNCFIVLFCLCFTYSVYFHVLLCSYDPVLIPVFVLCSVEEASLATSWMTSSQIIFFQYLYNLTVILRTSLSIL